MEKDNFLSMDYRYFNLPNGNGWSSSQSDNKLIANENLKHRNQCSPYPEKEQYTFGRPLEIQQRLTQVTVPFCATSQL